MNHKYYETTVADITKNGDINSVYIEKGQLAKLLGLAHNMHSGILSNVLKTDAGKSPVHVITMTDKLMALESNAVSGRSSAVINQIIGILIGCLLMYLVILLNFQDSSKDMMILSLLGYNSKEINRLLVDVYRPIFAILFILMLPIALFINLRIHQLISIQTNEYIPFTINGWLLLLAWLVIMLLYSVVVFFFKQKTSSIIRKNEASY
ncbi:FtsX-like permease family protein [compost metagenome]